MRKRWMTLLLCLCLVFTMLPATAFAGEEQAAGTGAAPAAECICTGLCGNGSVNKECPVCGAEGADLTACKGEGTQPDTPEAPMDMTESPSETIETEDMVIPDSSEGAGTEEEVPAVECICTGLCGNDSVNKACPVCGAEGADLTACKGEATQPDTSETLTEPPADMTESPSETYDDAGKRGTRRRTRNTTG